MLYNYAVCITMVLGLSPIFNREQNLALVIVNLCTFLCDACPLHYYYYDILNYEYQLFIYIIILTCTNINILNDILLNISAYLLIITVYILEAI